MNCNKCGVERESGIKDTIPLCHACYIQIAESGKNPDLEVSNVSI